MSSSNKVALAKLCKRHYHMMPIASHRHRYLLSRCLSSVFTKISDRKAKQSIAFGLLLLTSALTTSVSAQTVNICDRTSQVRTEILSEISATNNCAAVTATQLANITSLDLRFRSISTLQSGDFAGLSGLTYLDLSRNFLSALPADVFDDLRSLTELLLARNSLSALNADVFDSLTSLTALSLDGNALTTIEANTFSALTSLTYLDLSRNFLSALPADVFDDLRSLTELLLARNSLSALNADVFDSLTSLTTLVLWDNDLGALESNVFSALTSLTELTLSSNSSLTTLPVGVFDNLTSIDLLDLGNNNLNALPAGVFDNLSDLTFLDLGNNSLTALPDNLFTSLTSLVTLRLQDNAFTTRLPADIFDPLPGTAIVEIDLAPIGDLPSIPSLTLGGVTTINITNAFISRDRNGNDRTLRFTITPDNLSVSSATESGGVLTITASDTITGLTQLSIDANDDPDRDPTDPGDVGTTRTRTVAVEVVDTLVNICDRTAEVEAAILAAISPPTPVCTGITPVQLAGITELILFNMSISALQADDFAGLTSLTTLVLGGNDLTTIEANVFSALTSLTDLDLENNDLTTIEANAFSGLTSLTQLNLYDNNLSTLPDGVFDDLRSLTRLELFNNRLSTLPPGVFDNLTSLTQLGLRNNSLSTLPDGVFDNLTSLTQLDLKNNNLNALPSGLFNDLTSLNSLSLQGNTFTTPLPTDIFDDLPRDARIRIDLSPIGDFAVVLGASGMTTIDPSGAFISRGNSGRERTLSYSDIISNDTGVATVTNTGSMVTITAVGVGTTEVSITANDGIDDVTSTISVTVEAAMSICDRTTLVRSAILGAIPETNDCNLVTATQLAAIDHLDLRFDSIEALQSDDFAGLSGLTTLDLESNALGLTALPTGVFDDLTSLTTLNLERNGLGLTALPAGIFDNLTSLTELNLRNNFLSTLPTNIFDNLTSLTLLGLGDNALTALPTNIFDNLTSLTTLDLHDNALTALPTNIFDNLRSLTTLELGGNDLIALPAGVFDNLGSLTSLGLGVNDLIALPAGVFDNLGSLTLLAVAGNDLIALPAGVFDNLGSLTILELGDNDLIALPAGVFDNLGSLTRLELWDNSLTTIEANAFSGLTSLTTLLLYSNDLTTLKAGAFSGLTSLTTLVLGGNDLTTIEANVFSALTSLTDLDLENNDLTTIEANAFSGLTSLTRLDLNDNDLTTIEANAFSGLTSLTRLELFNNALTTIEANAFSDLTSLTELGLQNNSLNALPTNIFDNLTSLTQLDLRNNNLNALPSGLFNDLTSLNSLSLQGNTFTTPLPTDIFDDLPRDARIRIDLSPIGDFAVVLGASGMTTIDPSGAFISRGNSGGMRTLSYSDIMSNDNSVATVTNTGSMATITAVGVGTTEVSVTANDGRDEVTSTISVTVEAAMSICDRTTQVRSAILAVIPETNDCNLVTATQLAAITELNLSSMSISALLADDFAGLSGLTTLDLSGNLLTELPANVFFALTNLGTLRLQGNTFATPLPADIFADLPSDATIQIDLSPIGDLDGVMLAIGDTAPIDLSSAFIFRDSLGTDIYPTLSATPDNTAVATVSLTGGATGTITAVAGGTTEVSITADTPFSIPATRTISVTVETGTGICDRTAEVRSAILAAIPETDDCNLVTALQLARITSLNLSSMSIGSLLSGDFAGLIGLTTLNLSDNLLSTLPANLFDPLTSLTFLDLDNNSLSALDADIFSALTSLTILDLRSNDLIALDADVFSDLTSLEILDLSSNSLGTLDANLFSALTSLITLNLFNNSLSTLPPNVFDPLTNLIILSLYNNILGALDANLFSALTNLAILDLGSNNLSALPANLFSGRTSLSILLLQDNIFITPLPTDIFDDLPSDATIEIDLSPFSDLADVALDASGMDTIDLSGAFISRDNTGTARPLSYSAIISNDAGVATVTNTGSMVTITAVAVGTTAVSITANDGIDDVTRTISVTVEAAMGICDRTTEVESAILAAIPSSPTCNTVTATQLAAITELNLFSMSIGSLLADDFAGLVSLTTLNLQDNSLSTLPADIFDNLTNLTRLYLDGNSLSTLPASVSDLTSLTRLGLRGNNLSNVLGADTFSALTNLEELDLSKTSLSILPANIFDSLTSLVQLYLDDNSISTLPANIFDSLTSLETLDLGPNSINTLESDVFSTLTNLKRLYLDDNNLSALPAGLFSRLTILDTLGLQDNTFTTPLPTDIFDDLPSDARIGIDLAPFGHLAVALDASGMDTIDLSGAFISREFFGNDRTLSYSAIISNDTGVATVTNTGSMVTITAVGVGTTEVSITANDGIDDVTRTISVIVEAAMGICDRTTGVRSAILAAIHETDDCNLVTATQLATITDLNLRLRSISTLQSGDFAGLSGLTSLILSNNNLITLPADVFDDLTNLTRLYLDDNSLSALPADVFDDLTNLTRLYLDDNSLSALPADVFDDLMSLTELGLSDNSLSTLPAGVFDDLTSLIFLDLSGNSLSAFNANVFSTLTNLEGLYLFNNALMILPAGVFDDLVSLTYLLLNNNDLSALPANVFDPLTSLIFLDLSGNSLSAFNADVFSTLTNLEGLYLFNNALMTLPAGVFDDLVSLTALDLSGNSLSALPAGLFSRLTILDTLGLQDNTFTTPLPTDIFDDLPSDARIGIDLAPFGHLAVALDASGMDTIDLSGAFISREFFGNDRTLSYSAIISNDTGVATVTNTGSMVTITAVGVGTTEVSITANDGIDDVTRTISVIVEAAMGICDRTTGVRSAILAAIHETDDCNLVTATQLATITDLNLRLRSISTLQSGDFAGLSGLTSLILSNNNLITLETNVFDPLTSLIFLNLSYNSLSTLPADVFDNLTSLTTLDLSFNDLSALPADIFDNLTSLAALVLWNNDLGALESNVFSALTSLTYLDLASNSLMTLPANLFDPLTSLTTLGLSFNPLNTPLPTDLFDPLPSDAVIEIDLSPIGDLPSIPSLTVSGTTTVTVSDAFISRDNVGVDRVLTYTVTPMNTAIATASESGGVVTIEGVAMGTTDVTITATDVSGTATQTIFVTVANVGIVAYDATMDGNQISTVTIADENSGTAMFYVELLSAPAGDVVMSVMSSDTDEGTVDPPTLTFTSTNWNVRQLITVTAVDDSISNDDSFMVDFVITTGDGGNYTSSLTLPSVTVMVTDDETAPTTITLGISQPTIPETADATEITVTATIDGTAVLPTNTVVTVSVGGGTATSGTDYTATPSTLTIIIPAEAASATQTFMIDPTDDGAGDNNETVMISGTAGGFTVNAATLTILEAGISVFDMASGGTSTDTITIANENSGTMTFYVRLISAPASDITLSVASSDINEGTVLPATLTFTAAAGTTSWDTRQALTVTAVNDNIDRDDTFTVDFAVTTGDGGNYLTTTTLSSVTVTIIDDDTAGIDAYDMATGGSEISTITTSEAAGAGNTATFYIELTSEPTGTVTVTISGLDATEHTSTPPNTLTFTPTGTTAWNTRQEITLTGVNDDVVDGDQTYDITLTVTGGGYDGVVETGSVTNTDDDTAAISIADMTVSENVGTATLTVTLTPAVTAGNVMVDGTTADGTATIAGADYTAITSQTLTFTAGSTSETLDIAINNDNIDETDETFTVMLSNLVLPAAVTGDVSITDATAMVTITDDDTLSDTINLSVSPLTVAETADATTITVTATIDGTAVSTTATDVTVSVGGGTATSGTDYAAVGDFTLTIPALSSSATQTFTIDPTEDTTDDNNETVTISGTAPGFTTINPATLTIVEAGISVHDAMSAGSQISTVTITEASGSDMLYVQLTSPPAGNVTLSVTSDDTNEGTVTPPTLTFTNTNWNSRQPVTVTAVPDNIDRDGDSFMVDFAVTGGDGGNYTSSLTLPSVTVTITDDDTAGLMVDIGDGVTTSETGLNDSFTVVLDSQPTDTVTVTISGLRATEHSLPPFGTTTLMFTTTNWLNAQTVTLIGENDNDVDGDQIYDLTLTPSGGGYTGVTAPTVSITNEDDDTAALSIADLTIDENTGTATLTVTLTPAVTAGNVMVDGTTADGTATIAGADYTAITSQTLTFTAGSTSETLDIAINNDNIDEIDETFTVMLDTLTTPATVTTVSIADTTATVTIIDDDTAGIDAYDMATGGSEISTITTSEAAGAGNTATFYIELTSEPTGTVTVTISGLDATEHTSTPPNTLTFTPTGTTAWNTRQEITLTGVNDDVVDGDQTYDITLTVTGGGYDGVVETGSVTNTDDDTAAISIADMTVSENVGTATLTVTLTPAVTAGNVMVDGTTADGTATIAGADYTAITSQTLTFTAGSTSETLDITINNDNIDEIDETFTVTLDNLMLPAAVTGDVSITDATAEVTITDDDTFSDTINLSVSPLTVAETADATTITVTATIDGTAVSPTDTTVTVSVGGGTATSGTDYTAVPSFTLTIPALSLSATGTFMIDPTEDTTDDNNETVMISGTAGGFTTVNAATLTIVEAGISVHDAMSAGSQISTVTITEASGSDMLYVQLTSPPAGNVTLSVTSDDTNEGTVTPPTLTFTNTNWNSRQPVTVTAVPDNIDRDGDSFMVDFAVTGGDGGNYTSSLTLPSVTVTITDDDTAGLMVDIGDGVTTSETGLNDSFTVVLDSQPTDTVTVTISGLRATEHSLPPFGTTTLMFTTTNWLNAQTVTLIGENDNDVDGDQIYDLTLTPSGGGYTGVTAPTVSITNEDDDTAALSIADLTIDENTGTATLTVTLTPAVTAGNVMVDGTTADGTATIAGADYTAITSQTLTFTAGSTSETLDIAINNDNIDEIDETFTVMLDTLTTPATVTTVSIADTTATVTIIDDDTAGIDAYDMATGGSEISTITTSEAAGAGNTATFYIELTSEPTGTVTVTISGLDATEHTSTPPNTLTFTPTGTTAWNTRQEITLTGVNDDVVDGDQTYDITLTVTGGGYDGVVETGSVTNTDDDTAAISIADMTVSENVGTATLTVTLTPAVTAGNVMVDGTTADGTATIAGADYTAITSQTLTFTAGSTSETLDITINNDNIDEIDETFTVTLDNLMLPAAVTGDVSITDATAEVTITDDDTFSDTINLSVSPLTVAETADATTITVTATIDGTAVSPTDTTVTVSVGGGTATSGTDYTAVPSFTLTIPALSLSATGTFMIDPTEDTTDDNNETVMISGTAGGFTTVNAATLTIVEAGISVHDAMSAGSQISTVTITEASGSDMLYVQLTSPPAGNVTLSVTSDDTNEGTVTPPTLTFTNTNWNSRQPVTVTAVPDNIDRDGDSFMVDFAVTGGDGGNYTSSLTLPSVTVTITDDDTAGLMVDIGDGVTTSETGLNDSFTVVLDSQPTDTVTVTISGLRATEHSLPPFGTTTLMFTTTNWLNAQTVTLIGENDNDVDGDQIYDLTLTPSGGGYTGVTAPTVSITNEDDDTAALSIADLTIDENTGTATLTVTLTPAVTAGNVMVDGTTADGTATIAGADYTAITSQTLTFTAGSTSETLDIAINNDNIDEIDETFTVMLDTLTTPATVTTVSIADTTATVTIIDDDTAGIDAYDMATGGSEISTITTSEAAGAGNTATFYIELTSEPTGTVTVTISGLDATEHTSTPPNTLTFTPTGTTAWNTRQEITLTGVNDDVVDGDQTYDITLTVTGGGYDGVVETGSVTNTDDDTAAISIADMTVSENVGTATLTVTLTPAVTAGNVMVDGTTADGTATIAGADYTAITSQTLTFTAGSTSETLDIAINNDNIDEIDETFTVTLDNLMLPAAVTGDVSITDATAEVTITDDDTFSDTINLSVSPLTVAETADATTITVTATIDGTAVSPTDTTVTVSVGGGTATSGTDYTAVPSFTLTIPALSLSATGTFMIDPTEDTTDDNNETVMISGTAGGFTTVNAATLTIVEAGISVHDAMSAGSQISTVTITEASGSDMLYVQLTSPPAGNVTLSVTSDDTNEGTVTPPTLTFTNTNWNSRQPVTVTAVPDNIDRDGDSFMVDFAVTGGDGGNYTSSLTLPSVTVTITDDDTFSDTINLSVSPLTVAETADATTITVTATIDGTAVSPTDTTVTVSVGGGTATSGTDYTAVPSFTLTIPALSLSATGTFMIDPTEDTTDDNNETVMISGTAGGFTTVNAATLTIVEAGISVHDAMSAGSQISTVTITEASGSDMLYVQLTSPPAGNVTLSVTSDDTNEGTVTPPTLTFTNTNWNSRQPVTVTAVPDNIDRDGDSFMVDFAVTGGDGGNYTSSLTLPSVTVTITDDDVASDTIVLTISPDSVTETAGEILLTVTATLNGAASATDTMVEVIISDEGTASPNTDYTLARISGNITIPTGSITLPTSSLTTITILAEMTSGLGNFTITPVADDVGDNGETVTISGESGSFTVNAATLTIIEFSEEEQQAIEQTVAAQASGITQVVTEQIGIRLVSRASTSSGSGGSTQERQSLSSIDWQDDLAKFTYEGLKRLDSGADMSLDWLLRAAGGNGQLLMPLGARSLTLWATGGGISTKGDGVADYDGDVKSFILGIDTALANDWLAGVAISYNDSEIDYTMEGTPEANKTEQTLYSIHPYLSRTVSQGLTLWGTVGYGFGDVDFSRSGATGASQATSDVTQWMAAGGLEKQIITNSPWQGALRIKGLWGNAEVDSATYDRGATIAKVDSDFWRARMESELGYNFLLSGANIRPYVLIGGRWDHSDATIVSGDEWHIDVGGGVELSDNDFALDISVRTQVTEGDTEEDSIFATGSLTYDLEQDGRGLQISLSRPLNNTSPAFDSHSFNEGTESGLSAAPLTSELAYGWTVRPWGLKGALQTYTQARFDSDDRHYAVGLELAVNALTLNFESGYGEADNTGLESLFKTKIRW